MDASEIKYKMRVKTNSQLGDPKSWNVAPELTKTRQPNREGNIIGYVDGHGGDVWSVRHDDGTVGAYSMREFQPVPVAPAETNSNDRLTLDQLLDLEDDANRPILQR